MRFILCFVINFGVHTNEAWQVLGMMQIIGKVFSIYQRSVWVRANAKTKGGRKASTISSPHSTRKIVFRLPYAL